MPLVLEHLLNNQDEAFCQDGPSTSGTPASPPSVTAVRTKFKRRETPCETCRSRRVRCDAWQRTPSRCTRCEQLDVACKVVHDTGDVRDSNVQSEVRAQIDRLNDILEALANQQPLGGTTEVVGETHHSDHMQVPYDTDIVGRFTRLCFSDVQSAAPTDERVGDLMIRAKQLLRSDEEMRERMMGDTGATPFFASSNATLEDLVQALPSHQDILKVVEYAASTVAFCLSLDHIFPPSWFYEVTEWTKSGAPFPWGPSRLAELYAVLATQLEDMDVSARNSAWVGAMPTSFKHRTIAFNIAQAKRALELAEYLDKPDVAAVRAVSLLVAHMTCYAQTTDYIPEGLALASVGISLAQQLDMHRESPHESALERYEKRAILSAFLRVMWNMSANAIGRPAAVPDMLRDVPPPDYLESAHLPEHLRNLPRGTKEEMNMLRIRHELSRLQYDISKVLAIGEMVSMKVFAGLHERLLNITKQVPPKYGYHVDANDCIKPNAILADPRSLMVSKMVSDYTELTHVSMHRIALGLQHGRYESPIQQYHTQELIMHARIVIHSWARMARAELGHLAAFAFSFASHISLAVSSVLDLADGNHKQTYREEARQAIAVYDRPDMRTAMPLAVRKLTIICRLLLDQPRLRAAEAASDQPAAKRNRPSDQFRDLGQPALRSLPETLGPESERSRKLPTSPLARTATRGSSSSSGPTSPSLRIIDKTSSRDSSANDSLNTPTDLTSDLFKGSFDFVVPPVVVDPEWSKLLDSLVGGALFDTGESIV